MNASTWVHISQLAALVGGILILLGAYGNYYFNKKLTQEKDNRSAVVGILEETETIVSVSGIAETHPVIEFGDSGSMLVWTGPAGEPMIRFWEDLALTIERMNDQVVVSTIIHDKSGNLIAELTRNEWKTNPSAAWDRNYTKDSLEVRGADGEVVLQVRVLPDRIQFQAKMFDRSGRGVYWGKMVGPDGDTGGGWEFTGENWPVLMNKIKPLFRYPSDLHLGEYVDGKMNGGSGG